MTTPGRRRATIAAMAPASFHQLPAVTDRPEPEVSSGRAIGWLLVFFGLTWARVTILAFWIFSDLLGDAYDGWVVPVVGFLVLPWTTMAYAIAWSISSHGVYGTEWLLVAAGVVLDLAVWAGALALR
jgi:hypothetical protein